jgi:hypothetical protein
MKKLMLLRCKILLLEWMLPKEILQTILSFECRFPFCSQPIYLHKMSTYLMNRSNFGQLVCPYRFSALEVLRRCIYLDNRNKVELQKAIQSPYLPLFFPRLLNPYYYPNEEQQKLRAGF